MSEEEKNEDIYAKMKKFFDSMQPFIDQSREMGDIMKRLMGQEQMMKKWLDSVQPTFEQKRQMEEIGKKLQLISDQNRKMMEALREWWKRFGQEWPGK